MRLISILFAVLFSTLSFSQSDEKATTILKKVAKQYKTYKGVSIQFSLTMENAQEDIKESSKGKAWVKGNNYKVNLMGVETFFDGTTKWSYIKDAEEVNITTPDPDDKNTFNPSKLFTEYEEGYKVRYIKEVFQNNRALHQIDLFPINVKGSEFNRIRIFVDKDKNQIYKIIRFGKDGNDYTITLSSIKKETALPDSLFKFEASKYPDVEVIDLRD